MNIGDIMIRIYENIDSDLYKLVNHIVHYNYIEKKKKLIKEKMKLAYKYSLEQSVLGETGCEIVILNCSKNIYGQYIPLIDVNILCSSDESLLNKTIDVLHTEDFQEYTNKCAVRNNIIKNNSNYHWLPIIKYPYLTGDSRNELLKELSITTDNTADDYDYDDYDDYDKYYNAHDNEIDNIIDRYIDKYIDKHNCKSYWDALDKIIEGKVNNYVSSKLDSDYTKFMNQLENIINKESK